VPHNNDDASGYAREEGDVEMEVEEEAEEEQGSVEQEQGPGVAGSGSGQSIEVSPADPTGRRVFRFLSHMRWRVTPYHPT
jgi:hypothetical protein